MGSSTPQVTIVLPGDEALVTEALLDKLDGPAMLDVRDPADVRALWTVSEVLQKALPQLFDPKYKTLLAEARTRLRESVGQSSDDPRDPSSAVSGHSLAFTDLHSGGKCVAVVRSVPGGVTVGLSQRSGGDCEVTFAPSDLRRFQELLGVAEKTQ
jgi:hypothetical protein